MNETQYTGWRAMAPVMVEPFDPIDTIARKELYECQRLAAQALHLKPGARSLLAALVGFYGGEPVQGRLLVWPANATLVERTGLSERALRVCLRALITLGIVSSKDSANGKRFAVRSKTGQVIDAFGIDLAPMVARRDEFQAMVDAEKVARDARERAFDMVTVHRRAAREAIRTLMHWFPETATDDLERAFDALEQRTPRRDSNASPEPILAEWSDLRERAEQRYRDAACGGKNNRHKETDKDAPDQSCQKGHEECEPASTALPQLAMACPDAFGYAGAVRNERDMIAEAARLRGAFGTHRSAWEEAMEKIGPIAAASAFFIVLQIYDEDQRGAGRIANFGGYFRAFVRKIAAGEIGIAGEVAKMRRRRMQ